MPTLVPVSVLKASIRAILRRLGYDLRRVLPEPFTKQQQLLRAWEVPAPVIFDAGANRGQTANAYRARFPEAMIFCFEPFPPLVACLEQKFQDDPLTKIIPLAVSDRSGRRPFHVSNSDYMSSLLP